MRPIATPSYTKEILERYDLYAKKGFGQNFLIEPGIVDKIARNAVVSDHTLAIEIGPGIGALTQYLCEYAKKVIAFEIDERLPEVLKDTLQAYDHVEIIQKDFLQIDIQELVERYKKEGYDVVVAANLPYYITTPILFKLFSSKAAVDSITVMMQKEVADRFSAQKNTKDYNALTVITQYLCDVRTVAKVPKNVFLPKPKVDSTVLQFHIKEVNSKVDEQAFFEMVKACFRQRRKTLLNNYGEYLKDKEKARIILEKGNIDAGLRAESLSLDEFLHVYEIQTTYEKENIL
ncbi:MAG: 16S rRNA (adenine(1518)-N(6)/adenine(1519)-N(6))-dimethyltransferase RsmA [Erysipelotrichaceae bacterium]|jgi:16S rRNA (adenine1518-N6/adenine1519-N6)-dimethyltransferase|nr:16S rRNA (adenine(1518)-N(6)/adenine(1519)-N(6))-dimethyltransferase RsmA [Erysipelotrichaceae bacterium]